MFGCQHAFREHGGGVASLNGDSRLRDDRPVVQLRRDKMHRRAVQPHASVKRLLMGFQARKARQQRRVHVQHAPRVMVDETGREHPHEAGQHDQIGPETVDFSRQRGVEAVAIGKLAVVDHRRGNAVRRCERKARGVRTVGNHGGDLRRPALVRAGANDSFHVASPSGNQDDEFFHPWILSFGGH